MTNPIQRAATNLKMADRVCVLTGAGVSKESGVPTFRDAQEGLWAKYDPAELATPEAYRKNPKLVWDWYAFRREIGNKAKPNNGHYALAELEKTIGALPVITQNVDDLHEQAGSTDVIHLHGNLYGNKCFYDCQGEPTLIDTSALVIDKDDTPPVCPHCGRKSVRPDVVWFGETLPMDNLKRAAALAAAADVILVIGTSGMVHPAASLPQYTRQGGGVLIEVNPDDTQLTSDMDIVLRGASGDVLPKLVEAYANL